MDADDDGSSATAPEQPPAVATPEQVESIKAVVRNPDDSRVLDRLESERRSLQNSEIAVNIDLKKMYAKRLLRGLGAQIAFVDLIFLGYAQFGVHWKISAQVMDVWLGATVVEVVGIVLVVTKHLFPSRDA